MQPQKNLVSKVIAALVLPLLVVSTVFAQKGWKSSKHDWGTPYEVFEFPVQTPGFVQVYTSGGHIEVKGSTSDEIVVEMYVRKRGDWMRAGEADLSNFDIQVQRTGRGVVAEARRVNRSSNFWDKNRTSISFVVYTPREMSAEVKTSGGHVTVSGLTGEVNAKTSGGHVTAEDVVGDFTLKTSGGHINVSEHKGNLYAKTSGGHLRLNDVQGTIEAKTSGGHVKLNRVAGYIDASTSGGHITAEILDIDQGLSLKTSGGHINVTLPEGIGMDLDLRGSRVSTGYLTKFSGTVEKRYIRGSLNGGGIPVTMRTSGGHVNVRTN